MLVSDNGVSSLAKTDQGLFAMKTLWGPTVPETHIDGS